MTLTRLLVGSVNRLSEYSSVTARVSVAAEVANLHYNLLTCAQQLSLAQRDAASRAETALLTEINARAGFSAPALAALAGASAADGKSRVTQQGAQCDAVRFAK